MNKLFLFIIAFVLSCNNPKTPYHKDKIDEVSIIESDLEQQSLKNTHIINIKSEEGFIPLRYKTVPLQQLSKGQYNPENIILYLFNGNQVELIDTSNIDFYKVLIQVNNKMMTGYIIKQYKGVCTIKELPSGFHSSTNRKTIDSLTSFNRIWICEKHLKDIDILINSPITDFIDGNIEADPEITILFGIYPGEIHRQKIRRENRWSSDQTTHFWVNKPIYYRYTYLNDMISFIYTEPIIPERILSYKLNGDTLSIKGDELNDNVKIYPMDRKRAFTNDSMDLWIMNDSIRMRDISFLRKKIKISNEDINHTYFTHILKEFIKTK